jgi:hypothetical protein
MSKTAALVDTMADVLRAAIRRRTRRIDPERKCP